MAKNLLSNLLAVTKFPEAVAPQVLSSYMAEHKDPLARNPHWGENVRKFLNPWPSKDILWRLLWAGNRVVLDAVLDSKDRRTVVVRGVLSTWRLSLEDQKRLVAQPLGRNAITCLLQDGSIAPEVRAKVSQGNPWAGKVRVGSSFGWHDSYVEAPSELRHPIDDSTPDGVFGVSGSTPTIGGVDEEVARINYASATYSVQALLPPLLLR